MLDKLVVWVRGMKLPDNYLKEALIRGMCRPMGHVLKVQVKLPTGYVGEVVRVHVKINVNAKLFHFVSITRDRKKELYKVKYEKVPFFCSACGLLGHWHEECGTGEHDESKLEWCPVMLADGGRGRGCGRGSGSDPAGNGMYRGRGRDRAGATDPRFEDTELGSHVGRYSYYEGVDIEYKEYSSRKRLPFQTVRNLPELTENSTVLALVDKRNNLEEGNTVSLAENMPGKVLAQNKSRRSDGEDDSKISAVPDVGADMTQ